MGKNRNYNRISTEARVELQPEEIEKTTLDVEPEEPEAPEIPVEVVDEPKAKTGVVTGCKKLNVRQEPKADAEVSRIIDANTKVDIIDEAGDFYKIGEGEYCMKNFITID